MLRCDVMTSSVCAGCALLLSVSSDDADYCWWVTMISWPGCRRCCEWYWWLNRLTKFVSGTEMDCSALCGLSSYATVMMMMNRETHDDWWCYYWDVRWWLMAPVRRLTELWNVSALNWCWENWLGTGERFMVLTVQFSQSTISCVSRGVKEYRRHYSGISGRFIMEWN